MTLTKDREVRKLEIEESQSLISENPIIRARTQKNSIYCKTEIHHSTC
jgi:hypothetical protein